ncbi:hypothetical protein MKY04_09180 [Lysinibacillus telephonicus]|uniref:hypothetical protein n=1 Tax=Lysinibacillus telephonicus TaxID=1714840 RepID=UPI0031FCE930
MQMTKNGIPIDIPSQRKKAPTTGKFSVPKDFYKFKRFATMVGFEEGCNVIATVPMGHPEFNNFINKGFKVIEVWDRRNIA